MAHTVERIDWYTSNDIRDICSIFHTAWKMKESLDQTVELFGANHITRSAYRSYVIRSGDTIASHAGLFSREIRVDNSRVTIGCLASVCTHPQHKKEGMASDILAVVFKEAHSASVPFESILFQTQLKAFYQKLKAFEISNKVINSQDNNKNPFWDPHIMCYSRHAKFPAGMIDLMGPGF